MEPIAPASSGHRMPVALTLFGILVIVVIAIGLLIHFALPGGFKGVISAQSLPQELYGASLIASVEGKSSVYTRQPFWYAARRVPGAVTGASTNGDVILARTEAGYSVFEGNTLRTQVNQPIEAPSIPPVVSAIMYAQQVQNEDLESTGPRTGGSRITNPAHWQIQLLLANASSATPVIAGYAPLFIDDSSFLFVAADGIYRYTLESGHITKLLDRVFPVVVTPVIQSPDRTLIAFRDLVTRSTSIYQLDADSLKLVMEMSEHFQSPTLSNTALYDVKGTPTGAEVWKYPFDGSSAEMIHVFPRELAITDIVF